MPIENLLPIRQAIGFRRLSTADRIKLERELGFELCPNLEYRYILFRKAGTGAWQLDDEYLLKFRCQTQTGRNLNECKMYRDYCAYSIKNNEILRGIK